MPPAADDGAYRDAGFDRATLHPFDAGSPDSDAALLAAGARHACAALVDGSVRSWGDDSSGPASASIAGIHASGHVQ